MEQLEQLRAMRDSAMARLEAARRALEASPDAKLVNSLSVLIVDLEEALGISSSTEGSETAEGDASPADGELEEEPEAEPAAEADPAGELVSAEPEATVEPEAGSDDSEDATLAAAFEDVSAEGDGGEAFTEDQGGDAFLTGMNGLDAGGEPELAVEAEGDEGAELDSDDVANAIAEVLAGEPEFSEAGEPELTEEELLARALADELEGLEISDDAPRSRGGTSYGSAARLKPSID